MKTETEVASGWDDLIFENRNKEYGAYDIRKSYSGNTTTATVICLLGASGLLLMSGFTFLSDKKITVKDGEKPIEMAIIPPIAPVRPPQTTVTPPPPRHVVKDFPPIVTTQDVPDQPVIADPTPPAVDGPGDPNGSVDVVVGSVGTDVVVSIPAIPDDKPFITAEVMPAYVGGMADMIKYLQRNLRYPSKSKRMEIQGTVYVGFVVNREGKVIDVSIVRGISDDCDKEAIRVISAMPAWKAGSQQGRPVSVRMVLPVTFRLNPNR